jgi:hypothetical protein
MEEMRALTGIPLELRCNKHLKLARKNNKNLELQLRVRQINTQGRLNANNFTHETDN